MTNFIQMVSATTEFSHIQTIQDPGLGLCRVPARLHVFYSTLCGLIYICMHIMWYRNVRYSYAFYDISPDDDAYVRMSGALGVLVQQNPNT